MTTKTTRKPFAIWKVGDEEYKLKLKSSDICEAEEALGGSLINFIGSESGLPLLKNMMIITHYAMRSWNHSIKLNDVYDIYDKYIEEGGSQVDFFSSVYMDVYQVSGFFSKSQSKELEKTAKEATK